MKILRIIIIFALASSMVLSAAQQAPTEPEESEEESADFSEEQGALIDAINDQHPDAVHDALEALEKTGQSTTFLTDDDDNTPLIMAAFYGNYEVVDIIINFLESHLGQDYVANYINQKNASNNSALSAAAGQFVQLNDQNDPDKTKRTAYRSIMKLLIQHEAETNKNVRTMYPFLKELYKDVALPDSIPTLSPEAYKKNLIQAISYNNTNDVHAALQGLTKVKESANFLACGNSPLKLAAARGNGMVVNLIINNLKKNMQTFDAAINRVSTDDNSALTAAAEKYFNKQNTYEPIILMLLRHNAAIRPRDALKYPFLIKLQEQTVQDIKEEVAKKVSFATVIKE
jgi:ankyrin repeat protein